MSDLLPGADSRFKAMILVSLCLITVPSQVRADLPTVQQLIRQVEELCRESEKETGEVAGWPLMELARARAYTGDYAGAVRTAQPIPGLWKGAALQSCWEIHFELTGTAAELTAVSVGEPSLDKIVSEQMRVDAAKMLAKAGRSAEAAKLLPRDNEQDDEKARFSSRRSLMDFHLFMADDQVQRGNKSEAAASLQQAWANLERLPEGRRRIEWIEAMVKHWLRLGNSDQARMATGAALRLVRDRSQKGTASNLSALDWARVGKMQALLGEPVVARETFAESLQQEEAADKDEDSATSQNENLRASFYVCTVGQIGAWQAVAGLKAEAAASYAKAISRVKTLTVARERDFILLKLIQVLCADGEIDGALTALEQMQGAYWKALGYCRCAEKLAADRQQAKAQDYCKKAEAVADGEPDLENYADMFVKIAEAAAKSGDLPAARRCLNKTLQVSRTTKEHKHHQGVARAQVRIGLLDDAYETIQTIPQIEFRELPLAELTREAAKREALARTKDVNK